METGINVFRRVLILTKIITLKKGVGCLLAHTMGLGKTLQVITLLITLSLLPPEAKVDMPEHLRKDSRKYLVVCPPGIVINWRNEFKRWTPRDCTDALGPVLCVNDTTLTDRLYTIKRWARDGGVLLSILLVELVLTKYQLDTVSFVLYLGRTKRLKNKKKCYEDGFLIPVRIS